MLQNPQGHGILKFGKAGSQKRKRLQKAKNDNFELCPSYPRNLR